MIARTEDEVSVVSWVGATSKWMEVLATRIVLNNAEPRPVAQRNESELGVVSSPLMNNSFGLVLWDGLTTQWVYELARVQMFYMERSRLLA